MEVQSYQQLWRRLARTYGEGEAKAMARMVYEVGYGLTFSDICLGKEAQVPVDELEGIVGRLERHEPIQYIIGVTDFCGRRFSVNKHVLIPRSETGELCQWIVQAEQEACRTAESYALLDMGTGSGCIAVTLAAELPQADVTAWDISDEALTVARENARRNGVEVAFQQVDVLNAPPLPCRYDVIVSNPPYICQQEASDMEANVLDFEPHTALFVPDDDPLLFYRAIAHYGIQALKPGGRLYFELNPLYTSHTTELLGRMSYHGIEIHPDLYGKQRMIRATR